SLGQKWKLAAFLVHVEFPPIGPRFIDTRGYSRRFDAGFGGLSKSRLQHRPRTGKLKMTLAIVGSFMLGAFQALHAQAKPPAFVVGGITVKDEAGYNENFLKPAQKSIADHGGKYLAGGYNKTVSLAGTEPPNRVVILQFANMDVVKAWREEGEADLENNVGNK